MLGWWPSFCKHAASVRQELFSPFPRCWSIPKLQNIFIAKRPSLSVCFAWNTHPHEPDAISAPRLYPGRRE